MRNSIFWGWRPLIAATLFLFLFAAGFGVAVEASLEPTIPASESDAFQIEEEGGEDQPLVPEVGKSGKRGFRYGTVLEYWFLEPGTKFAGMPADLSLTGMIDDSKQLFSGNAMLRDAELKKYAVRQGILQWTAYLRVNQAGKHVFALSVNGLEDAATAYSGAALLFNNDVKAMAAADKDGSATVDFAAPGWYRMHVWLWWSHARKPQFQDYGVTLKIREPGTLSLRPVTRKDLYYKFP